MKKPPICKIPDCNEPKMKRPGNTTLHFPYCEDHQIEAILSKASAEREKDKQELEKMRERVGKSNHKKKKSG
jgi:hypothetical protein